MKSMKSEYNFHVYNLRLFLMKYYKLRLIEPLNLGDGSGYMDMTVQERDRWDETKPYLESKEKNKRMDSIL